MLRSAWEEIRNKKLVFVGIILLDVVVAVFGTLGLRDLRNYYVPLDVQPTGNGATLIRSILDVNATHVGRIPVGTTVRIIGENDEWYFISYDPIKAVHKSVMEKVNEDLWQRFLQILPNPPWMLIISVLFVVWWPKVRSWIWNGSRNERHSYSE